MKQLTIIVFVLALGIWILNVNSLQVQPSTPTPTPTTTPSPTTTPTPLTALTLYSTYQQYRSQHDLPPIGYNPALCANYGDIRVKEIQTDWSHNGFWIHEGKTSYYEIGENLARFYSTPEAVMNAWDNSPEHKRNLLDRGYYNVCFSIDGTYVVQTLSS
jgi:uncharacterized protein YkwD